METIQHEHHQIIITTEATTTSSTTNGDTEQSSAQDLANLSVVNINATAAQFRDSSDADDYILNGEENEMNGVSNDDTNNNISTLSREMQLIKHVAREQALYNPKHENYRNASRRDIKWTEIAAAIGWNEPQCKAKWKAMRDQYCRELKRSKFNPKANVKWKYFKDLEFLRPYALSRNYRPRYVPNNLTNRTNTPPTSMTNNKALTTVTTTTAATSKTLSEAAANLIANDFNLLSRLQNIKMESQTHQDEQQQDGQQEFEQLTNVLEQQQQHPDNWSFLAATTPEAALSSNNLLSESHHQSQQQEQSHQQLPSHKINNNVNSNNIDATSNSSADDALLYNAIADCVAAVEANVKQQQQKEVDELLMLPSTQPNPASTTGTATAISIDEEDDDPIHTFLNIESYFEKELIAMVQLEDIIYNSYHPNYRNTKRKLDVWGDIARKLKKTVKQCRLKWKAMRDQYIREHKRLRNRVNIESLPRWKHYDALSFLQKFIKHKRTSEVEEKQNFQMPKEGADVNECMLDSTIESAHLIAQQQQQQQQQISPLSIGCSSQGTAGCKQSEPESGFYLTFQMPKEEIDIEECMIDSTIESTHLVGQQHQQQQIQLHADLVSLTNAMVQQQQKNHQQNEDSKKSICVSNGTAAIELPKRNMDGSITATTLVAINANHMKNNNHNNSAHDYDPMDIDNFIVGNSGDASDVEQGQDDAGVLDSSDEEPKSAKHFVGIDGENSDNDDNAEHDSIPQEAELQNFKSIVNVCSNHPTLLRSISNSNRPHCQNALKQQNIDDGDDTDDDDNNDDNGDDHIMQVVGLGRDEVVLINDATVAQLSFVASSATTLTTSTSQHEATSSGTTMTTTSGAGYYNSENNNSSNVTTTHDVGSVLSAIVTCADFANSFESAEASTTLLSASLNASVTPATAVTTTTTTTTSSLTNPIACAINLATSTSATSPAAASSDDDEVGIFFKAIAMKIRNVKLSPIEFTDLQIEVLRVINQSLRKN